MNIQLIDVSTITLHVSLQRYDSWSHSFFKTQKLPDLHEFSSICIRSCAESRVFKFEFKWCKNIITATSTSTSTCKYRKHNRFPYNNPNLGTLLKIISRTCTCMSTWAFHQSWGMVLEVCWTITSWKTMCVSWVICNSMWNLHSLYGAVWEG